MATFRTQPAYDITKSKLSEVRQLYLNRQYRQCASHCQELLDAITDNAHPLQKVTIHFYLGLSHDAMGRSMHHLSASRLPSLTLAEQHYLAAVAALSNPITTTFIPRSSTLSILYEELDLPDDNASSSSRGPSKRNSLDSNQSIESTSTSMTSDNEDYHRESAKPSPFKVRRSGTQTSASALNHHQAATDALATMFSLHSTATSASTSLLHLSNDDSGPFTVSTARHISRYNAHLASFSTMLHAHISSVQSVKHKSGANLGFASTDRTERIRRGRERKWARSQFVPSRYEELCRRALAELD